MIVFSTLTAKLFLATVDKRRKDFSFFLKQDKKDGRIWDVLFTDDGGTVSAGEDGSLRWCAPNGSSFDENVMVARAGVRCLAVKICKTKLIDCSLSKRILFVCVCFLTFIFCFCFKVRESLVVCGCDDGTVSMWRKPQSPVCVAEWPLAPKVRARAVAVDAKTGAAR
jgi:hypothetical protein